MCTGDVCDSELPIVGMVPSEEHGWAVVSDLAELTAQVRAGGFSCWWCDKGFVVTDKVDIDHVKLFVGNCGWTLTQLQSELDRNVWFHVTADKGDQAKLGLHGPLGAGSEVTQAMWSGALSNLGERRCMCWGNFDSCICLGGEYAELADLPISHSWLWELLEEDWKSRHDELIDRIEANRPNAG